MNSISRSSSSAPRQTFTGGIGYERRWRDKGELTLGLQKTSYKKEVETPAGFLPTSKDSPWLMNGTLSVYATKKLVFYGGYTKGLEESPVAPDNARNKDEAPPAIITVQKDAGFRYAINDRLRFMAGVFDVKKPYYALDDTKLYTNLGSLRHRGVELSLSGQLAKGLSVVAGTVFLDATVSGKEVEQGKIGKRRIGAIPRATSLSVDYQAPWFDGLSVDFFYESTSNRVANRQNTLFIPPRYTINPGFRYRFDLAGDPSVLRGQIGTLNNVYGYGSAGEDSFTTSPAVTRSVSLPTSKLPKGVRCKPAPHFLHLVAYCPASAPNASRAKALAAAAVVNVSSCKDDVISG